MDLKAIFLVFSVILTYINNIHKFMSTFNTELFNKEGPFPFSEHLLLLNTRKRGLSPFWYKEESWISWN